MSRPLRDVPIVRWGAIAWAVLGLVGTAIVVVAVLGRLRLVVVPLTIALFPAALLAPLSERLRRAMPDAVAVAIVVVGFLVAFFGLLVGLGWLIANELTAVVDTLEQSYGDVRRWAADTFGVDLPSADEALDRIGGMSGGEGELGQRATTIAVTGIELVSSLLFGIVALFLYLKDGDRFAAWLRDLFPGRVRDDVDEIGRRVWFTIGAYFRGQIIVAAVDALFIGLGLLVLGVPLALPLTVLVFIGGLFPIVGAFTAGAVAVLVALADGGIGLALAVLALNIVVQQVEGDVLAPLVVGRATQLHPLAVLIALTAGAVTLGILGAFLAVPVTASVARVVGYLRRDMRDPVTEEMDGRPGPGATAEPSGTVAEPS